MTISEWRVKRKDLAQVMFRMEFISLLQYSNIAKIAIKKKWLKDDGFDFR